MKEVYVLSGLGVDHRVFEHFRFENMRVTFLAWVLPVKHESLTAYAKRMAQQITTAHPILIGLSFGGMVAIEIAKILAVQKIICIASAKEKAEIPLLFRLLGRLKVHTLLPTARLKRSNSLTYWFFGVHTQEDKKLLKAILDDTDPVFLRWAIDAILTWNNTTIPSNVLHIHGDRDRLLPHRLVTVDYSIVGGGHFMTVNKASQIEAIISAHL